MSWYNPFSKIRELKRQIDIIRFDYNELNRDHTAYYESSMTHLDLLEKLIEKKNTDLKRATALAIKNEALALKLEEENEALLLTLHELKFGEESCMCPPNYVCNKCKERKLNAGGVEISK